MAKKFYPKCSMATKTKQDVIDAIEERRENKYPICFTKLGPVKSKLLTHARMQAYMNEEYNAMISNIEFGDDAVGRETERALFHLAQIITSSPDVKFELEESSEEEDFDEE